MAYYTQTNDDSSIVKRGIVHGSGQTDLDIQTPLSYTTFIRLGRSAGCGATKAGQFGRNAVITGTRGAV